MFNKILIGLTIYLIIGCLFLIRFIHRINDPEKYMRKKYKNNPAKAQENIDKLREFMERPLASTDYDYLFDNELVKKVTKFLMIFMMISYWPILVLKNPFKKEE